MLKVVCEYPDEKVIASDIVVVWAKHIRVTGDAEDGAIVCGELCKTVDEITDAREAEIVEYFTRQENFKGLSIKVVREPIKVGHFYTKKKIPSELARGTN